VHSTKELRSDSFEIEIAGAPATVADLFPGFDERDRLGVVVRDPCGGLGASTLILATVTAYYDFQRAKSDDFFIYPDYFLFHAGAPLGDHNMLDVWPSHKELVVPDDAEELLRAINDRGVTRLAVPDGKPGRPEFGRETLASARARIVSALAYSAGGATVCADVTVRGNDVTESYVSAVLEQSTGVPEETRAAITTGRAALRAGGRPVETYRRIALDEALGRLAPTPVTVAA
jgi:hypothetical protein